MLFECFGRDAWKCFLNDMNEICLFLLRTELWLEWYVLRDWDLKLPLHLSVMMLATQYELRLAPSNVVGWQWTDTVVSISAILIGTPVSSNEVW